MKSSSVALLVMLTVAMASSGLSVATALGESGGGSIAGVVGSELRGLVARANNMFSSAAAGWHTAGAGASVAEAKNLRAVAARRRRRQPREGAGASCVTAAMCRKRRVICGKRCYGASRRAASVNHVPTRCVVKCKKCVPTC